MSTRPDDCPVCPAGTCKAYRHVREKMRTEPEKWRAIHDQLNTPATVPLAGSIAMLKRMKACPHRSTPANCGCGVATCGLGKGRAGKVNHAECYECLSEGS